VTAARMLLHLRHPSAIIPQNCEDETWSRHFETSAMDTRTRDASTTSPFDIPTPTIYRQDSILMSSRSQMITTCFLPLSSTFVNPWLSVHEQSCDKLSIKWPL
jgi:hypothetical protein